MMYNVLKAIICVLIIVIGAIAQEQSKPSLLSSRQSRPSVLSSAVVFPGGFVSYSVRDGYRKYEGVRELEHIERNNLPMYGASGGKRFALKNPRLRIQSTIEFGWGSVIDDVFPLDDDDYFLNLSMHDDLFTVGIQNELHILLPSTGKHSYFLSLGPGVGWSSFKRAGKIFGMQVLGEEITNTIYFNFNIGAGMDYMINRKRALSMSYNFRIWHPVSHNDLAMFPMGVDYKEQFFTHMLQAQILILPQRSKSN